jgi:hypothetical protein
MPFDRGYFNGAFLFNLFFMVYTFKDLLLSRKLELEYKEQDNLILVSITNYLDVDDKANYFQLTKKEAYQLSGVLHHLQKEMK